jgi:hypothetical protein
MTFFPDLLLKQAPCLSAVVIAYFLVLKKEPWEFIPE